MKGGPGDLGYAGTAPAPLPKSRRDTRHIAVRPGQSIGDIARAYRVPERTIIEANHLKPPYKLTAGMRLTIPGAAVSPARQAAVASAPLPPVTPAPTAIAPPSSPQVISLDGPAPPRPPAGPPRMSPPQTEVAASVAAEVAREAAQSPPPAPVAARTPEPKPAAAPVREGAPPASELHGGRYPWPVGGR